MVCESACLLVYVTEKMYLHNRRRTLEDFKKKKEKGHLPRYLMRTPGRTFFLFFKNLFFPPSLVRIRLRRLCPEKWVRSFDIVPFDYCFRWVVFNLTQHLQHVWTVLKRNLLCQVAPFPPWKGRPFPKNVPLSKIFKRPQISDISLEKQKGIVALIVTLTSASSYIYDI